MLNQKNLENTIENQNAQITELSIRIEALDREIAEFLKELEATPEQLSAFIENKENFTEKNWSSLQTEKEKLEALLQRSLKNVKNPTLTKKTYAEKNVGNNWLFVK